MRPILFFYLLTGIITALDTGLQWDFNILLKKKVIQQIEHEDELHELLNKNFELTLVTTLTNDKYPVSHAPLYVLFADRSIIQLRTFDSLCSSANCCFFLSPICVSPIILIARLFHANEQHSVLSENPTKPKHVGLSIGHQKSHNFLEIRMADGKNLQVVWDFQKAAFITLGRPKMSAAAVYL